MALVGSVSSSFLNFGSRHAFAWILPQSLLLSLAIDLPFEGLISNLGLMGGTPQPPACSTGVSSIATLETRVAILLVSIKADSRKGSRMQTDRSFAGREELEAARREESDKGHLMKREVVGETRTTANAEREIGRLGRECDASFHKAFRKEAMRFWKIACVVVEQLRTYPHRDIPGELKPTEFESGLHLSI